MREILFRGKRTDNCEWETGSLVIIRGGCYDEEMYIADKMTGYNTPIIPETIGQFTGLTDKNGTKIFEGDIVRYGTNTNRAENKEINEVVFETRGGSGYFGIRISKIETWQFCLGVPAKLMEVIGNIYDNPELLKGGADNAE